jgi:peroxiredoxin
MALQTPVKHGTEKLVDFHLKGTDGRSYSLADVEGTNGTIVMFICNHCPYVKGVIGRLVEDVRALQAEGIGAVAIMSNDTVNYPDDSFDNMKRFAKQHGFVFPYVIDETQDVARAYGAVCTPDLFGFNRDGKLEYRGRVDSAGSQPASGSEKRELRDAMVEIARTGQGPAEQIPSVGCSIKWRN